MKIHFLGAAHEVTGSKHLLEVNGVKILLDCGLFQGKRKESDIKNRNLNLDPKDIDIVILSHAHLDHSGNLPYLTKNGFTGKIYMTHQTADLIPLMLMDSAYIQEQDNNFIKKSNIKTDVPTEPLYTQEDIPFVLEKIESRVYNKKFLIANEIYVKFYHSEHILGSAIVEVTWKENQEEKILVFSGDLGRKNKNLLPDLEIPKKADYCIIESTYGNRLHKTKQNSKEKIIKIVKDTVSKKGKIIIPAFSIQRTQELLYDLHLLQIENKIPKIKIYIDSPLAIKVTKIYQKYRFSFDKETHEDFFSNGKVPLEEDNIKYTLDVKDSKKLVDVKEPCIIMAASGMCEGGRIRHHLKNSIENSNSTILFVGYQAENTLGRKILERKNFVKIFGKQYKLRANIYKINGYSGHADSKELINFIENIKGLKNIFVVHGDPTQSYDFAHKLRKIVGDNCNVDIPEKNEVIEI
jgi:metallo-beta-lactamase family protein